MLRKFILRYGVVLLACGLVGAGLCFRVVKMIGTPLWVDEAESSINALTILEHGIPVASYQGMPIYENTLFEPWPESPQYEFHDSSYSRRGVAVYHGWLPLYTIAAAEALAGIRPDEPKPVPIVLHGVDSVFRRTIAPRVPALLFSLGFMGLMFLAGKEIAGETGALAALTAASLAASSINFGHQARYYSATLFFIAWFILTLLRVQRLGRMRDFCTLGIVTGLLFHAHQLSAVVAVIVAGCGLNRIWVHPRWLWKCVISGVTFAVLVVPWALFSGFLETVSNVPKIYQLLHGWPDWTAYLRENFGAAILGVAALIWGSVWARRLARGKPESANSYALVPQQLVLLCSWLVVGWLLFHTVIASASFFAERLTLLLLVPYILLVSSAVAVFWDQWPKCVPILAGAISVLIILLGLDQRPHFRPAPVLEHQAVVPAISYLQSRTFERGTLFFAPPNDHLIWTYYTGLPVQSIAPIRKTFFDHYPRPIVYIERRSAAGFASEAEIRLAASASGNELSATQIGKLRSDLWRSQMTEDLRTEGMKPAESEPLPDYMSSISTVTRDRSITGDQKYVTDFSRLPMFAGITYRSSRELWLGYFYRFVNPEGRIGKSSAWYERLARSRPTLVPESALVIYDSSPLVSTTSP